MTKNINIMLIYIVCKFLKRLMDVVPLFRWNTGFIIQLLWAASQNATFRNVALYFYGWNLN